MDDEQAGLRDGTGPEAVGWTYEAEHDHRRRAAFAAARDEGRKIDAAGVVNASRLYTPRYIVDFLLHNSLAALWCEMYPQQTADSWPLMVRRGTPQGERSPRPVRELRLLDPCCGCGAFLVPAFDMFVELYARERLMADAGLIPPEWAVPTHEVPVAILTHNLHGADLDADAVAITAALLRARAGGQAAANLMVPKLPIGSLAIANWKDQRFDVVVANPPYVGFRMLDPSVKELVRAEDPLARSDLAVAFQSRCFGLLADRGICATVTPASWLTGRESLPLRRHILQTGGPRIAVALGQRVFRAAPLLFVGLSVIERGRRPDSLRVLRPTVGAGAQGLRAAVADQGVETTRELIEQLPLRPFLPGAPTAVLALAGRGPRVGDLFASFDGVWSGDNARDTRYWWEVGEVPGWVPLSGGQGNEPWVAPTRLRIRAEFAAGQPIRDGGVEYARVAGGRLSARIAAPGTASLAGIVTLMPRGDDGVGRVEELLAMFNSRIGAAWLRTLASGLNFNPGYAAEIPLGRDAPSDALREAVHRLVALRAELVSRDPTSETFLDVRSPWTPDPLPRQITAGEAEVEELLAAHLGLDAETMAQLAPVQRPVRRTDPVADYLSVRVMRLLGFRWSRDEVRATIDPAEIIGPSATLNHIVDALARYLAAEGVEDPGIDLRRWVERDFLLHHTRRFKGRPIVVASGASRFRIDPGRRDPTRGT